MLKINKARSEGKCSKCDHYQKQIARLEKAFIKADDENVRRCMQYEDKILKFKVEKEWLKAEESSGSQSKKMVLKGSDQCNTILRAPTSTDRSENARLDKAMPQANDQVYSVSKLKKGGN